MTTRDIDDENATFYGNDPASCHGLYARTRSGRCQGCGIAGEHPKRESDDGDRPTPNNVTRFPSSQHDRDLRAFAKAVRELPDGTFVSSAPAAPVTGPFTAEEAAAFNRMFEARAGVTSIDRTTSGTYAAPAPTMFESVAQTQGLTQLDTAVARAQGNPWNVVCGDCLVETFGGECKTIGGVTGDRCAHCKCSLRGRSQYPIRQKDIDAAPPYRLRLVKKEKRS